MCVCVCVCVCVCLCEYISLCLTSRARLAALIGTGVHLLLASMATMIYIGFFIRIYHRYTAVDVALAFYVLFRFV